VTDSFMGCQRACVIRSVANFLTWSSLIQTGHHLSGPLCLLYLLLYHPHHSISPHLSWTSLSLCLSLSLSLHHGTSKWLESPSLAPSHTSPLQFLALHLHSISPSLHDPFILTSSSIFPSPSQTLSLTHTHTHTHTHTLKLWVSESPAISSRALKPNDSRIITTVRKCACA